MYNLSKIQCHDFSMRQGQIFSLTVRVVLELERTECALQAAVSEFSQSR
jgi:hypothetical protein